MRRRNLVLIAIVPIILLMLHIALVVADGFTDEPQRTGYIIVLGNTVHPNGRVSYRLELRLKRALALHFENPDTRILVSGATGVEGQNEADAMARWLIRKGVQNDVVLRDRTGATTFKTAIHSRRLIKQNRSLYHSEPVTLVSHYYHISRARLAFQRAGFRHIGTAHVVGLEWREPWSLLREVPAFYYYLFRSYPDYAPSTEE